MHWHAYLWTGNGAERGREAEPPGFATSPLPPMRTGDVLPRCVDVQWENGSRAAGSSRSA